MLIASGTSIIFNKHIYLLPKHFNMTFNSATSSASIKLLISILKKMINTWAKVTNIAHAFTFRILRALNTGQ